MKKKIFSLCAILVICMSVFPVYATELSEKEYKDIVLVVDDTAPADDVITIVKLGNELKERYSRESV